MLFCSTGGGSAKKWGVPRVTRTLRPSEARSMMQDMLAGIFSALEAFDRPKARAPTSWTLQQ